MSCVLWYETIVITRSENKDAKLYTTSTQDFFTTCMDVYVPFIQKHGIKQATTLLGVKELFATLIIELEATVVK